MIPAIRWSPGIRWSPAIRWSPGIWWSIRSIDFDNRKVYGDTYITDGLVLIVTSLLFCKSSNQTRLWLNTVDLWKYLDVKKTHWTTIRKDLHLKNKAPSAAFVFLTTYNVAEFITPVLRARVKNGVWQIFRASMWKNYRHKDVLRFLFSCPSSSIPSEWVDSSLSTIDATIHAHCTRSCQIPSMWFCIWWSLSSY